RTRGIGSHRRRGDRERKAVLRKPAGPPPPVRAVVWRAPRTAGLRRFPRADVFAGQHVAQREVEEIARLAVDVAGEVHERHAPDHPAPAEIPTLEPWNGAFRLPIALQGPADRRELRRGRDPIKLEPGVADVHGEVDADLAPCSDHPLGERLSGDVLPVEISDEVLAREADAGPRRMDFVRLPGRRPSPPR